MKLSELSKILSQLDMHPSRALGQNFLVDENCLSALVRAAVPVSGEEILEVGPGTGVLTERLVAAGCRVTAVEFDSRLARYIRERFEGVDGFRLVEGDACKVDYTSLFPVGTRFRCVANLPYSCASVLLARLAGLPNPPASFHVLLQKEMAERLAAPVGTPAYGVLTVRLAFRYRARIARIVPRGVFFPPPEVDSAFLALEALDAPLADRALLEAADRLATAAFSQRRKQARRLLSGVVPGFDFAGALESMGLPATARAENISPQQYIQLARSANESG